MVRGEFDNDVEEEGRTLTECSLENPSESPSAAAAAKEVELNESEPTIHQNSIVSFTWSSPSLSFCSDTSVLNATTGKIATQNMVGGVLASRVVDVSFASISFIAPIYPST